MAGQLEIYDGGGLSRQEFETLALQQLDGMYATARHLCKNDDDAKDLVQDAYLRAFKFYDRFQPGTNFRGWIFQLMYRLFINRYHHQKRERERLVNSDDQLALIPDTRQNPELSAIMHLEAESVEEALQQLPAIYRDVVVLSDVNEFTYEEIASILDIPVGTVMSRLFRGRRQLRQILGEKAAGTVNSNDAPLDFNQYRQARG